jgi:methionyl-tRNA synthetase
MLFLTILVSKLHIIEKTDAYCNRYKSSICLVFCKAGIDCTCFVPTTTTTTQSPAQKFSSYLQKFNLSYPNATEAAYRQEVFLKNLDTITQFNLASSSFQLGINQFTDSVS